MHKFPLRFFVTTIASVFFSEMLIMFLLSILPKMSDWQEAFIDSTLLTLLILPPLYFLQYRPLFREISERLLIEKEFIKSEENSKKQAQQLQQALEILQKEKISSLGRMVAGIAHEINNPINFIYANISHVKDYISIFESLFFLYQKAYPEPTIEIADLVRKHDIEFIAEDLPNLMSSMERGTERIRQIVISLRNFSRLDEAQRKTVNIHDGLESTLLLLQSKLKNEVNNSNIEIVKDYGQLPEVECYPGQLNQAFFNIINNAIDILEDTTRQPKIIHIRTQIVDKKWVNISIEDSGPGMTEEVKSHLFDPFFTTKAVGKGTGLGLSISYQIVVNMHGGKLRFISSVGRGAEFLIEIPI
jgi:two-component system, NtrC family, sensor kinase